MLRKESNVYLTQQPPLLLGYKSEKVIAPRDTVVVVRLKVLTTERTVLRDIM